MSGINLQELEASQMMNVIHYIFESDMKFNSEDELVSRSSVREYIYKRFYDKEYPFKYVPALNNKTRPRPEDEIDSDDPYGMSTGSNAFKPFDPASLSDQPQTHKGYIPPTNFDPLADNPFEGILDGPAG